MEFTLTFLRILYLGITLTSPVLLVLLSTIIVMGWISGRLEGWPRSEAIYWAFITATTVGYGDLHPRHRLSRILAILISLVGLVLTGILVSIALHAMSIAFEAHVDVESVKVLVKSLEST